MLELALTFGVAALVSAVIIFATIRRKKTHVQLERKKKSGPKNIPMSQAYKKQGRIDTGADFEEIRRQAGGKATTDKLRAQGISALAQVSKQISEEGDTDPK